MRFRSPGLILLAVCGLWPLRALAEEPMLAVVVAATRADQPGSEEIVQIFKRKKLFWKDGHRIQPVNLPADHPLRQQFTRQLLHQSAEAQEDYWNQQYFQGVLPPHVLASEAAVLRFVTGTDASIGYLPACPADPRLRVLLLLTTDGRLLSLAAAPNCGQ